ncbi:hypothetical protein HJC23_001519 [Cyclotella cryptica]|uniref:Uncharacterized protein n=1 Tax=Cyclotella cryptica TaxID=29204 RepID=A0ABD3P5T1_9STRA|eukprot:CCRYP_017404-RA/>CCRYP_017404-RA protein AED:0.36 eAED:0.11 QI:0/-1/0/1/-1/1/1/0/155
MTCDKCVVLDSVSLGNCSSKTEEEKEEEEETVPSNTEKMEASMEEMLTKLSSMSYGLALPLHDETTADGTIPLAYALVGQGSRRTSSRNHAKVKRRSQKPIYISVGDGIALRDAVALVAYTCGESRIPEAVRQADIIYGRFLLREVEGGGTTMEK